MSATNDNTNEAKAKGRRRWKTIIIVLGTIVGTIVAIPVVFVIVIGLSTSTEELVTMRAEELNESRGVMVDSATRLYGASAQGTTLVVTYTLIDGWFEILFERVSEMLGENATPEQIEAIMEQGDKKKACEERDQLGGGEIAVVIEYRDERGATLSTTEANSTSC